MIIQPTLFDGERMGWEDALVLTATSLRAYGPDSFVSR